jgi:hypothetical protein
MVSAEAPNLIAGSGCRRAPGARTGAGERCSAAYGIAGPQRATRRCAPCRSIMIGVDVMSRFEAVCVEFRKDQV